MATSGSKQHKVRQGDCISSIAEKNGLFWQTLWDANPDLQQIRNDPNLLQPGDIVLVPEKREGEQSGATEQKHTFRKKGVPAKLRLILEHNDQPLKNKPYVLKVDGRLVEGTTDDRGFLEQPISPLAKKAEIEIEDLHFEFLLGSMDPIEETTGIQARLQNLGFYDGDIDGDAGPLTSAALAEFQAFSNLEATGELDDSTRTQLFSRQDEEHETQKEEESEQDDDEACDSADEEVDQEDSNDGEAVDEEEQFPEYEPEQVEDVSDEEEGT